MKFAITRVTLPKLNLSWCHRIAFARARACLAKKTVILRVFYVEKTEQRRPVIRAARPMSH